MRRGLYTDMDPEMKKACKFSALAVPAILVCLFFAKPAFCQEIEMNLQEMNGKSDLILQVQVESMQSKWVYGAAGKNIVTSTTFRVRECIKGDINSTNLLTLDVLGGKVGDTTQFVSNSVTFIPGEESILFLQKNPLCVTGGFQGKYPVVDGSVLVDNQKVKSTEFVEILKESKADPQALPSFLKKIRVEPVTNGEYNPEGVRRTSLKSTTDTYEVTGLISDFSGEKDSDADGYYETCSFQIRINGDAVPGPDTVYFRINCTTTGQTWTSTDSYVISGSAVDYYNFGFDQSHFAGHFSGNTELIFTVEMLDFSKSNILAADTHPEGDVVKIDDASQSLPVISSISPDRASAGTNSEITISGSGFGTSQGSGKVEFFYRDGQQKIAASIFSWSDTQIICNVPVETVNGYPASAGSGPVTVTTDAGQMSNRYLFRVTFSYGEIKWPGNTLAYRINEDLSVIAGEGQAIQNAANSWNAANASFQFEYAGSHANTASARNNYNDLAWATLSSSTTIAQASIWYSGGTIAECDIIFNDRFNWNASASVPSGTIDIETIALHELGHWLNLRDQYGSFSDGEYDQMKVMYGFANYGQNKRVLHADDLAGIQWIYGTATTVSISGFVKTAAGAGVSNVVLNGLPGTPQTNASGYYSTDIVTGWSGTATPGKAGFTFSLPSRDYSNVTGSLTGQNYTATEITPDATLSNLLVSGKSIAGFSKNTLAYTVEVPSGTTVVPVVGGTPTDPNATLVISPAASLPGVTTVQVTAYDGITQKTYTVSFTNAKNNDATLSLLLVSGETVPGFVTTFLTYTVVLPFGTTAVPAVAATTKDPNATLVITPATSLPGATTVQVTAENGTTTKIYTVNFTVEPASDDATLSDLKVNGATVSGFRSSVSSYTVTLPYGVTTVPAVTAFTRHPGATKVIDPASLLPGETRVSVTAQNGTVSKIYTVSFHVTKNSDASLADLIVDGVRIDSFSKAKLNYQVVLPFGTLTIPTVTAVPADVKAIHAITQAESLPGTATVQVTADNGTTAQTYTVGFILTVPSSDATLSDLLVNGSSIPNFDRTSLSYEIVLPPGVPTPPDILPITTAASATKEIELPESVPGIATITVTAEDRITTNHYEVYFRFPGSGMDDHAYQNNLLLYPNPNRGSFTVEYNSPNADPIRISMMDLTGRVIVDQLEKGNNGLLVKTIRLTNRQPGSYLIRLIDGATVSHKIVIVE